MGHAKSEKQRAFVRARAIEAGGELFFVLLHHDLFQFHFPEEMKHFEELIKGHDELATIENNEFNCRVAIKYKDKK
jgi:hypothetical protein